MNSPLAVSIWYDGGEEYQNWKRKPKLPHVFGMRQTHEPNVCKERCAKHCAMPLQPALARQLFQLVPCVVKENSGLVMRVSLLYGEKASVTHVARQASNNDWCKPKSMNLIARGLCWR
mmetsp:Transcript_87140/g.281437  ORF Transcript_87140/g.281437 Transcript_87140/m.281437 type:complete len:118 (+) Transcript_87140:475-828(+)